MSESSSLSSSPPLAAAKYVRTSTANCPFPPPNSTIRIEGVTVTAAAADDDDGDDVPAVAGGGRRGDDETSTRDDIQFATAFAYSGEKRVEGVYH